MCFSLFIASGSFFLGQAKVFPKPMRIYPLLAIPAFLPLVFLLYWLVRVAFTKWRPRVESATPRIVGRLAEVERPLVVRTKRAGG
jgi:peptidoglycan/LPS O-acetylase OafA/YrhL